MLKKTTILLLVGLLSLTVTLPLQAAEKAPLDAAALKGVKTAKGIFDINLNDANSLPLYLGVIKETYASLAAQGVKPDLIVAFRGMAVTLVSSERANFTPEQQESLKLADELIKELAKVGVRFEACAVATRLFGVKNENILPQIELVGNTFISLIGYQTKGYALIPIQ